MTFFAEPPTTEPNLVLDLISALSGSSLGWLGQSLAWENITSLRNDHTHPSVQPKIAHYFLFANWRASIDNWHETCVKIR
jgi:hypothetical protein